MVTKASSEGAVLEVFSDGDSVFTDNTSRSESPASEPVWTHAMKVHSRDIIHSDTIAELVPEMGFLGSSGADLSLHSRDNISARYSVDLSPSPSGRSRTTEEGCLTEECNENDDNEEEENTTPTGGQDGEEDRTLVLSSLADIQHCAGDETSSRSDGTSTEKESLDDLHSKMAQSEGSDKEDIGGSEIGAKPLTPGREEGEGQQTREVCAPPVEEERLVDREDAEALVHCYLVERTYGTDKTDS